MRNLVETTSFGAFLLFVLGFVYVQVVSLGVLQVLPMHEAMIAHQVLGVLGAALIYSSVFAEERAPWPAVGRTGLGAGRFVLVVLTAIVLGVAANVGMGLVLELIPQWESIADAYEKQMRRLVFDATGVDRLLGVASICVAAPIVEEVLFRGTILPEQRKDQSIAVAVLMNGALFSAFHLNPVNFLPLLPVGVYLAHLTIRTESLVPAILAHAVLNAFNGVVLPELFPEAIESERMGAAEVFGEGSMLPPEAQMGLLLAGLGVVAAGLWWASLRAPRGDREEEQTG